MPFELGLDLGIREHATARLKSKKCLVIDTEKYRYQAALSDMSGSDISTYGKKNQVENIISCLRNWFIIVLKPSQPSSSSIYLEYTEFVSDLQTNLEDLGFSAKDIQNLTVPEYIHYAREWIANRKTIDTQ
jgi:hypothetical protein